MRPPYLLAVLLTLLASGTTATAQSRVLEADLAWETLASLRAKGFSVQNLGEFPPALTMDGDAPRRLYRAYSRDGRQIVDCLVWEQDDTARCWIVADHHRG
jgi:hypothetical protein